MDWRTHLSLIKSITHKIYCEGVERRIIKNIQILDHEAGLYAITQLLTDENTGVIDDPEEIELVGNRVVHGGESFASTTEIAKAVKEEIKKLFDLAPLHNPANFLGIEMTEKIFTTARKIAVFDTDFHQTMPEQAFLT